MVDYLDGKNTFSNVEIYNLDIYQNIEPYTSTITHTDALSQINTTTYLFNYADTQVMINQGKIYDLTLHENASATIIDIMLSNNNSILQDQSKKLTSGIVIGSNAVLTVDSAYLNNLSIYGSIMPQTNVILNDVQFGPSGCIYFNENATVTVQNIQITQLDTQLNNFNVLSGNTIDILTGTVNCNSAMVSLAGNELTNVEFNCNSGQLNLNYSNYNNVTLSGDYNTFGLTNLTELNTSGSLINFYGVQNTLSINNNLNYILSVGITETNNIFDESFSLNNVSFLNTSIYYVQNYQIQNTLDTLNINIPVSYENCSHEGNNTIKLNINSSASVINNIFSDIELIINGYVVRFKQYIQ